MKFKKGDIIHYKNNDSEYYYIDGVDTSCEIYYGHVVFPYLSDWRTRSWSFGYANKFYEEVSKIKQALRL